MSLETISSPDLIEKSWSTTFQIVSFSCCWTETGNTCYWCERVVQLHGNSIKLDEKLYQEFFIIEIGIISHKAANRSVCVSRLPSPRLFSSSFYLIIFMRLFMIITRRGLGSARLHVYGFMMPIQCNHLWSPLMASKKEEKRTVSSRTFLIAPLWGCFGVRPDFLLAIWFWQWRLKFTTHIPDTHEYRYSDQDRKLHFVTPPTHSPLKYWPGIARHAVNGTMIHLVTTVNLSLVETLPSEDEITVSFGCFGHLQITGGGAD